MSLVVWLPLNGNLENQGLSNVTVTNNGATVDNNGKIGKCYRFDGDVYLNLSKGIDTTKDYSICYWFKEFENNTLSQFRVVYQCGSLIVGQYGELLDIYDSAGSGFDVFTKINDTTTWHHACFTFQSSENLVTIYIDGKYAISKTVTSIPTSGSYAIIGKRSNGTYLFQGNLNDVRIYNHCLSAKEVKELSKGLVLHYRLAGPGQENFILESHKVTSGSAATGITRSYTSEGYLKVVSTSGNGNWCSVGFAKDSNDNVGNKLSVGDTYTMSVEIKVENGTILPSIFINDGNSYKRLQGTIKINKWVQYSYTAVWNTPGTSYGNISLHLGFSGVIGTYYFRNFKLEKGNIATPWCPAPGDALYSTMGYNNNIEYDCSGFGNNGTKSGAEMIWDINSPRYTTSYKFIGSGQKISVAKKIVPQLTDATFSVWFYRSDYGPQPWESLITIQNDPVNNVNNYFEIETKYSTTNDTRIWVYNGANAPVSKTNAYELNKWTHVAVTLNSTQIKLYINGELVSTGTSHTLPDKANYYIGSYNGSQSFKGNISDVRIYVTELSAEDIAELYHSVVIVDNTGKSYAYEYFEAR